MMLMMMMMMMMTMMLLIIHTSKCNSNALAATFLCVWIEIVKS